jgi:hypothetical protein
MANPSSEIDIRENYLSRRGELLTILLKDRTTNKNIIWATDSYIKFDKNDFSPKKQIKAELVTGDYSKIIQPRASKSIDEQKKRTKEKAEVFTDLKIVKQMNDEIDKNRQTKIDWKDYIKELKLEITCGEAPFIVSRYDPTANGKIIDIKNRVGFLDKKLKAVNRFCKIEEDWVNWAKEAYKSSYGYEWQGDNLLIARENLLYTFIDYYEDNFDKKPSLKIQEEIADIISWNIFQMDGLKYVIPMSCKSQKSNSKILQIPFYDLNLSNRENCLECLGCKLSNPFQHNGKYVKIMNWEKNKKIKFVELLRK